MTTVPTSPAASQQAAVDAALLVLKSIGLSPDDLTAASGQRPTVPTFAEYVPVVSATVTDGTRKAYGSYWKRVTEQWGTRRLDEPTPSEIQHSSWRTSGRTWCPAATLAAGAAPPKT